LAVATNTGSLSIREVSFEKASDLNSIVCSLKVSKEWIECMSYNPDKNKLAVGSHDNHIYIFTCPAYQQILCLKGHSSFITGLDWSLDSSYIRSVCGAYELLFFDVNKGN
jgi:WD40 repeat protein